MGEAGAEEAAATLPDGATCGACKFVKRCLAFGYTASRDQRECDWLPIRYRRTTESPDAD